MLQNVSESRFCMWRALFAIAHADDHVSVDERNFLNSLLEREPFSEAQINILKSDIDYKQDIRVLFSQISNQQDRSDFFQFARTLVWCDGSFGDDEQKIMLELQKIHLKTVDFETLEDSGEIEFDDVDIDVDDDTPHEQTPPLQKRGFVSRLLRFLMGKA